MFESPTPQNTKRRAFLLLSFALHIAVIVVLASRAPMFIRPSSVAWGRHGTSEDIIYFASKPEPQSVSRKLLLPQKSRKKAVQPAPPQREVLRAGTDSGSLDFGPATGSEAKPALPLIFPDPVLYPWQVANVQGDVVVEVTIDVQGNVTNTRVLQSLKQEIDEKCVATLRSWRFKPATLDGIAIASRQDVHFHFPS